MEWKDRKRKLRFQKKKKVNDSRPPRRSLKNSLKGNKEQSNWPASTVMIFFVRRKGKGTFFFFFFSGRRTEIIIAENGNSRSIRYSR